MLCALAPPYLGSSHRGNRDPRASGRDRRSAADRTSRSVREVVERGGVRGQSLLCFLKRSLPQLFPPRDHCVHLLCPMPCFISEDRLFQRVCSSKGQAAERKPKPAGGRGARKLLGLLCLAEVEGGCRRSPPNLGLSKPSDRVVSACNSASPWPSRPRSSPRPSILGFVQVFPGPSLPKTVRA